MTERRREWPGGTSRERGAWLQFADCRVQQRSVGEEEEGVGMKWRWGWGVGGGRGERGVKYQAQCGLFFTFSL